MAFSAGKNGHSCSPLHLHSPGNHITSAGSPLQGMQHLAHRPGRRRDRIGHCPWKNEARFFPSNASFNFGAPFNRTKRQIVRKMPEKTWYSFHQVFHLTSQPRHSNLEVPKRRLLGAPYLQLSLGVDRLMAERLQFPERKPENVSVGAFSIWISRWWTLGQSKRMRCISQVSNFTELRLELIWV